MKQKRFERSTSGFEMLFRSGTGIFLALFLFLTLVAINVAQTLSLVLLPFSKKAFRAFNRGCAAFWWGLGVSSAKLRGIRLVVTGDTIPIEENAIVLSNHQQMVDILVLMIFAQSKSRLGDLKWFVKDVLKFVPGVGWGMLFLDCLFVKRNWEADKDKISSVFSKFSENSIPIWLISFVEGTRITPAKLERSRKFSEQKGLPVFNHVMVPRTKGFVASVQGLSNHVDAVYDLTIGYPQGIPSLWQVVQGLYPEFHVHVRRHALESLPQDSPKLSQWLMGTFVKKDHLLGDFLKMGTF